MVAATAAAGFRALAVREFNACGEEARRAVHTAVSDLWILLSLPSANIACQCT